MTVTSPTNTATFDGNGVTTVFPFAFRFFADTDLEVVRTLLDGSSSVLTLGVDYTVQGASEPGGGSITMTLPPAVGQHVSVRRLLAPLQLTDLRNQGKFFAEVHEDAFDYVTMLIQQLNSIIGTGPENSRALLLGTGDVDGAGQYEAKNNQIKDLGSAAGILNNAANLQDVHDVIAGVLAIINANPNLASGIAYTSFMNIVRTAQSKMSDLRTLKDSGATGSGGDELAAINAAIAAQSVGELYVPAGNFSVSGKPTNPNGVRLEGPGAVRQPETGGFRKWNTKFDDGICVGREYLHRAYQFIKTQDGNRTSTPAGGSSSNLNVFLYGDSTAVGYVDTVGPTPATALQVDLRPDRAIKRALNANGVRYVTVTQRAVSGTSWRDLNAIPDLSATSGLFVIKYGINDAVFTDQSGGVIDPQADVKLRIAAMAVEMRAKLTAIRAAANGGLGQLSILLVGPTCTADSPNGRNEEWFEQVRNVYVQAARDFQCCYVDPYQFVRDARTGALLWMDQPFGDGRTVHQLDTAMAQVWGMIIDETFPKSALREWGANSFRSIGSNGANEFANPATGPLGYLAGVTWERARAVDGFPKDGWLKTERFADGHARQTLYPSAAIASDNAAIMRGTAAAFTTWHPRWFGVAEALTFLTGWVDFATSTPVPSASLDDQGYVQVQGSIKNGTITTGTSVAALPNGMRPASTLYFAVSTNAGLGTMSVDSTGAIKIISGGDATRMSLDSIRFKAA